MKITTYDGNAFFNFITTPSDLQTSGIPKVVVASMLGHTIEVNEKYYTYDTSNMEQKQKIIQRRNVKFKDLTLIG